MQQSTLFNLSPLDGRYQSKCDSLRPLLSEYGLIYYRTVVEVQWLIFLSDCDQIVEITQLNPESRTKLVAIIENFNLECAEQIKSIERTTNHDVKAVEYFLQQQLEQDPSLKPLIPFIHFACTSEDINNLAYSLMLKATLDQVIIPEQQQLISQLCTLAEQTKAMPMLSRTHGQTASPTTMGKEVANVLHRIRRELSLLQQIALPAKINGAVGNFNAHQVAYPNIDWITLSQSFVESLELTWNSHTTQIEPHDGVAELMHITSRINTILIDFSRDIWGYISLGYFSQRKIEGEVGSSTMPHKVNPIDFENAEGNLGLANAMALHLASKLPISRWQRDLTDSTVMRNLATVFGYSMIAYQSLLKGISKLQPQAKVMLTDLSNRFEVLAEPIQTVMRRYGIADAYEQLKALTRGQTISLQDLAQLIDQLPISDDDKQRLAALKPETYIGMAVELTELALKND